MMIPTSSVNWHGQNRSNATHLSATDSEARLARKGDGQTKKEKHHQADVFSSLLDLTVV